MYQANRCRELQARRYTPSLVAGVLLAGGWVVGGRSEPGSVIWAEVPRCCADETTSDRNSQDADFSGDIRRSRQHDDHDLPCSGSGYVMRYAIVPRAFRRRPLDGQTAGRVRGRKCVGECLTARCDQASTARAARGPLPPWGSGWRRVELAVCRRRADWCLEHLCPQQPAVVTTTLPHAAPLPLLPCLRPPCAAPPIGRMVDAPAEREREPELAAVSAQP